jgi:hypothetical protein
MRGEDPSRSSDPGLKAGFERAREKFQLVSHTVLQRPGRWYTGLAPGCYAVGAFQDLNRDRRYSDEPALRVMHPDRLLELAPGQRVESLELVIPAGGRFSLDELDPMARQTADLAVRSHEDQTFVSLDQVAVEGQVVDLADPKFGEAKLIAGLDRSRFQPWFFFYPSGARLEPLAHFLTERVTRLQAEHGFDKMAVVAHSMGGLVSRAFLLEHHARVESDPIGLFISYSTPWEGVASAREGVERSPVVIDSWRDVAAGSDFLRAIFYRDPDAKAPRDLPEGISYHLIFGVEDQTIAVPSAIRWQVVREAANRWPLPYGHVDILDSPEASLLLNEILADYAD